MDTTARATLAPVIEDLWLRDAGQPYLDRADAGRALAARLRPHIRPEAIVVAIPSGGVPVGLAIAQELSRPLEIAVAMRLATPWGTCSAAAAVGFDGGVVLAEDLLPMLGLTPAELEDCVERTRAEVEARIRRFEAAVGRAPAPAGFPPVPPPVRGREVILVDEELNSPVAVQAAVEGLRRLEPLRIVLAVPSGTEAAVQALRSVVDLVVCPNLQHNDGAPRSAFVQSRHVSEEEARELLGSFRLRA